MYFPFSITPEYDANLTTPTLLIKLKEIIIYYANGIGVISVEVVNKYPVTYLFNNVDKIYPK